MRIWAMRSRALLLAAFAAVALSGWVAFGRGTEPGVAVVDAAQGGSDGRGVDEPPRSRPVMADQGTVQASLDALQRNGVLDQLTDQTQAAGLVAAEGAMAGRGLLPVFHIVECAEEACANVIAWGQANGMEASEAIMSLGHGSVEEFHVELSENVPPAAPQLVRHAEAVMAGVADIDGAVYTEWMADNRANVRGGGR